MHIVRCKDITKTKRVSGLGLCNPKEMNEACIAKLSWHIKTAGSALCCNVISGKYARKHIGENAAHSQVYDSTLWKHMVKLWPVLDLMTKWEVGNRQSINVWLDCWIGPGIRLIDHLTNTVAAAEESSMAAIMDSQGILNWPLLENILPQEIVDRIRAMDPPELDSTKSESRQFTISNAYYICAGTEAAESLEPWRDIWILHVLERIRSVVYLMQHEGLKTNKYLSQLLLKDPYCEDYIGEEETIIHVMRDCPQAKRVWI